MFFFTVPRIPAASAKAIFAMMVVRTIHGATVAKPISVSNVRIHFITIMIASKSFVVIVRMEVSIVPFVENKELDFPDHLRQ